MINFGRFFGICCLATLVSVPAWSTPVLTLTPGELIFGARGAQIGWGFSITNDADYIEVTMAQFCLDPLLPPSCPPAMGGVFTDFISVFNDIIVGHDGGTLPDTVAQDFDAALHLGLGSFDISPDTPIFFSDFGQIVVTYNVYDGDPNNGGNGILFDQKMYASAAVIVTDDPVFEPVPEPGSLLLAAGGVLGLLALRARR